VLQLASACAFAFAVKEQVFDEPNYEPDVARYQLHGVTFGTLRAHETASAPVMSVLAGLSGRLVPGDIRFRRIPIILAWALAVAVAFLLARSVDEEAFTAALLAALCFPHVPTAMASLLTEGPTMLLTLVGLWATWAGCTGRLHQRWAAVVAGAACGIAILTRQYALATAGAMILTWVLCTRSVLLVALSSLGVCAALAALGWVWGGLSSPASRLPSGPAMHSVVALNLARPLAALASVGAYIALLVRWRKSRIGWLGAIGAAAASALLVAGGIELWGNGPIATVIAKFDRFGNVVARALAASLGGAAVAALAAVCVGLVGLRHSLGGSASAILVFAAGSTTLFVLEQAGVGGTIPYFERYTYLMFPWAVYLTLRAFEAERGVVVAYLGTLAVVGQWMLWRHS